MLSYKGVVSLICLGILFCGGATYGADIKIGYIDSNRMLNSYKGKDELKDKLQKQLKKWEDQAMEKKQSIQEQIKKLESQAAMLSDEARSRKQKEVEQAQIEYEEFIQRIWGQEGEAKKINEEVMKPFIDTVNAILQKIGKEREYTMIFDVASTGVVYAKEGMDLTEEVLTELNQGFGPVSTKEEKAYFCIFKFKESGESVEYKDGETMTRLIKAGFVKGGYKNIESNKLSDALSQANIGKKEEEFTKDDAAKVGKLAQTSIAVIGEVKRVGEAVTVTCKVIDTNTSQILAEESGNSSKSEIKDLNELGTDIVTKLTRKLKD